MRIATTFHLRDQCRHFPRKNTAEKWALDFLFINGTEKNGIRKIRFKFYS